MIMLEAKPEKTSLDWPVAITGTRKTQPATFIAYTIGRKTPCYRCWSG